MSEVIDDLRRELANLKARVAHLETSEYAATVGDADTVDGIHASATPTASKLLALNGDAKLPANIVQPVGARVYNSVNLTIPNATWTPLTFDSERFDEPDGDIHSTVAETSKLVCRIAGTYVFFGGVRWSSSDVGVRLCWIYLNGTTPIGFQNRRPAGVEWLTISSIYKLAVGNWVELQVYQDTGGNLNVDANVAYSPEFAMVRIA